MVPQQDTMRILYVDDLVMNHAIFESMFVHSGYDCAFAQSGEEAVGLCLKSHYDLIIMDSVTGSLDGFLATKFIRNHERAELIRPSVILGLSFDDNFVTRLKASMSGMNAVIRKPMTMSMLKKIINRWFEPEDAEAAAMDPLKTDYANSYARQFLDEQAVLSLKEILKEKYPTTLDLFKQDIKKYVEQAYDALDGYDLKKVYDSMHTIKSASMQVGLIKVHELAAQLESICANDHPDIEHSMMCDIVRAQVDHIQHVYSLSERLLEQTK